MQGEGSVMSNRTGWGSLTWTEAEAVEELAFINLMGDTLWPEFIQRYVARVGGYLLVPDYWREPIR